MTKQAALPVAEPLDEPVQAAGGGTGPCTAGPFSVPPIYCVPQGLSTYSLTTNGCRPAGAYTWTGPQGVFSQQQSAVLFDAQNPAKGGDYYLEIVPPSGPAQTYYFTVFTPLTIRATQGIGANIQDVAPNEYVCQGAYMNFYIQEPSGWYSNRKWTNIRWSVTPNQPATTPTTPNFPYQTTSPFSGGPVQYTVTCKANSPCDGTESTATFTFYSKVRDAGCGQLERSASSGQLGISQSLAYPIPAESSLTIPASLASLVELRNGQGVQVRQTYSSSEEVRFATDDLPEGLYLLRKTSAAGQVSTQRIVIRH